jgi:DNA-directed RNA polymerase subunit beta'
VPAWSASRRRCATSPVAKGEKIVITRSGEVLITDDNGREREKHKVPYGATLQVADAQAGQGLERSLASLGSAHTRPIIAEYSGLVKFENVEEGGDRRQADRRSDGTFDAGGD